MYKITKENLDNFLIKAEKIQRDNKLKSKPKRMEKMQVRTTNLNSLRLNFSRWAKKTFEF